MRRKYYDTAASYYPIGSFMRSHPAPYYEGLQGIHTEFEAAQKAATERLKREIREAEASLARLQEALKKVESMTARTCPAVEDPF